MPRLTLEWEEGSLPADAAAGLEAGFATWSAAARAQAGVEPAALRSSVMPTFRERMQVFRGPDGERHMTRTGRVVNRFAPQPEDWDIEALAWSQANLCRYGGELYAQPDADGRLRAHAFYSTGEHQLNAIRAVDILHAHLPIRQRLRLRLYASVHDFVETRLSDLISVVKKMLPDAKAYEHELEGSFLPSLGLSPQIPPEVDAIDKRLVANEGPAVFPGTDAAFWRARTGGREPIPGIVVPDPRFVVRVPLSPTQRGGELGETIEMWSFPPLVARALIAEIRSTQETLARLEAA